MDRDDRPGMGSGAEADAATDAAEAIRAFQALHAEVGALRRALTALPEVIEGVRAPDYGPTLGVLVQGVGALDARLEALGARPVLAMTAQQHARALGDGVADVLRTAAATVRTQTEALERERTALAALIGQAMTGRAQGQRRGRVGFGAAGLALGLVLFPLAGVALPGGSYLAALATGTGDRWLAGSTLLRVANPESAAALIAASRLSTTNAEALQACTEAARRSGTAQRCLVSVPVPER